MPWYENVELTTALDELLLDSAPRVDLILAMLSDYFTDELYWVPIILFGVVVDEYSGHRGLGREPNDAITQALLTASATPAAQALTEHFAKEALR